MSPSPSKDSSIVRWLTELADDATSVPVVEQPRPYWSQRVTARELPQEALDSTTRRVRALVRELMGEQFFAEVLGFDCVDDSGGYGDFRSTPEHEFERRVGKPDLWAAQDAALSVDDLCDLIEVFHDLAARPTRGWVHFHGECGWVHHYGGGGFHPTRFDQRSGQALFRWRMNRVLSASALGVVLANDGEDVGRMTRTLPTGLAHLVEATLTTGADDDRDEINHAVALFRGRSATSQEKRSAIIALAGVLERHRLLLKEHLLSKDEGALFQIANDFDLRHRNADQRSDYDDAYLEWIFYWYLGTVCLVGRLVDRSDED